MPDVFISYSAKDAVVAELIRTKLKGRDIDVFLAGQDLTAGGNWTIEVKSALRDAKWVLVLVTKESLKSQPVMQEIGGAIFGKKKVVPIVLDVEFEKIPRWLSDYQGVSISAKDPDGLVAKIEGLAKKVEAAISKQTWLVIGLLVFALYIFSRN